MTMVFDKGPRESAEAFAAFRAYCDERSVRRVAARLQKDKSLIERWSARHSWVERSNAWDAHRARVAREAEEAVLARAAGSWAERYEESRRRDFELAQALREKAEAILASKGVKQGLADAIRAADVASRLAARACGVPEPSTAEQPAQAQAGASIQIVLPSNGREP